MRVVTFMGFFRRAHVLKGKCHCSENVTVLKSLCFVGCLPAFRSAGWVFNSGTGEPEIYDRNLSKAAHPLDMILTRYYLTSKISHETNDHQLIFVITLSITNNNIYCFLFQEVSTYEGLI